MREKTAKIYTDHKLNLHSARKMAEIPDNSVHLVITSPPYPMIEMWDEIFSLQDPEISHALQDEDGMRAFRLMHEVLQPVWNEIHRVLVPGGIACINIGDATRRLGKNFQLYPSHSEIISRFTEMGFQVLPEIIWRKETNSPTKFMGSGMLPGNAYVTLEHEFILIFRKGGKREFKTDEEKSCRRQSAFFWEERNQWFTDLWNFKGISQNLYNNSNKANQENLVPNHSENRSKDGFSRIRSGAFPFELPWRLILMYSMQGDTVLDPFLGTGTTMFAAMCAGRNSIGYEIDESFQNSILASLSELPQLSEQLIKNRIQNHKEFVIRKTSEQKSLKYENKHLDLPVFTGQEQDLAFPVLTQVDIKKPNKFKCFYKF